MASKLPKQGVITLADGLVNYLFHHSPTTSTSTASTPAPLVLIGGTAQTINSLVGHHTQLNKNGLLHYELRGQGRTTTLPLDDCSLSQHVKDFDNVISSHPDFTNEEGKVDLCGFSFGGRVALAIAAARPEKVRKMAVTGVPADRGATGRIILKNWLDALSRQDLEGFIWQSMSDGHSPKFLARHESKLEAWVKAAAAGNRAEAIAGLVGQTHTDDLLDPWHTVNLAKSAAGTLACDDGLFLVGDEDRLAPVSSCQALAKVGEWECQIIKNAGHSVPIEQPKLWRNAVKAHLDH